MSIILTQRFDAINERLSKWEALLHLPFHALSIPSFIQVNRLGAHISLPCHPFSEGKIEYIMHHPEDILEMFIKGLWR